MLFSRLLCVVAVFVIVLLDNAHGQYVRKAEYPTEQDRRAVYELDDWISHTSSNRFQNAVMDERNIYFATLDGGILRYNYLENYWDYPFTTSNGLPENSVLKVTYDPETGYLWAFFRKDVAVFLPSIETWISRSEAYDWPYTPPPPDTTQIIENPQYPPTGVFFDRKTLLKIPHFFANGPYSILPDWRLVDDETFDEYLFSGFIIDRFNQAWFLVNGFGIGMGNWNSQRIDFFRIGLPEIYPKVLEFQYDDLWVGGTPKGKGISAIALWPNESANWQYFQSRKISRLPSDEVFCMLADGDSMWFGGSYGISLYNRRNNKWQNYSTREGLANNKVNDLAILKDKLYIATDQGMSILNLLSGRVESFKDKRFINLRVNQFTVQADTLWIGTFRGLFRYIPVIKQLEFVPSRAATQDLEVTSLDYDNHELWFTSSGGVAVYNMLTGDWRSYPQVGLEIAPPYRDIKVTNQVVWVSTKSGLLKFDRTRNSWRLFTTEDGLLDNDCYRLLLDGDYISVANKGGITEFFWNSPYRSD
jgi:hypothetical protein